MNKKKSMLILILIFFIGLLLAAFFKVLETVKYSKCEQEVFSNVEYKGGNDFKVLHEKCMKK